MSETAIEEVARIVVKRADIRKADCPGKRRGIK